MKMSFDKFIIEQSPSDLDYGKLSIVSSSRYSSAMPWHINQVCDSIAQETSNIPINSIIDACANIGVDTILFRLLFPLADITAIELNTNTYNVLKENMDNISQITGQYKKPIITKNTDCLNFINQNCDIFYLDPPWPEHYKNGKINLTLSGYNLGDIINQIMTNNKIVIAKLPFNFDQDEFEYQINNGIDTTINYHTIYTNGKNPKISYLLAFVRLL